MAIKTCRAIALVTLLATTVVTSAYTLRNITTRDGLTNSAVLSVILRKDGKVAFGTCDGVNAYDGVHAWKIQGLGGGDFVSGNIVVGMAVGYENTDWILTDHGLTRCIDLGKNTIFYPQFQGLRKLRTNPDGDIFLLTDNLLHFSHPSTTEIKSKPINGIIPKDVLDYAITDKYLFIFKTDKTLRYSIRKEKDGYAIGKPVQVDSTPILAASNDGDIEFLVNDNGMLQSYSLTNGEKRTLCSIREEMNRGGSISQILDYYGTIFIAFKVYGLYCLSQENGRYTSRELPVRAGVTNIIKDLKRHIVWIATDGQGAIMYSEPVVSFFPLAFDDLWIDNVKPVRDLHLDKDGTLWVATKGSGIITLPQFDENIEPRKMPRKMYQGAKDGLSDDIVYAFAESRRPLFWICTENGLDYYSYETHSIRHVVSDEPLQYVINVWENGNTLWIVTLGKGIYQAEIGGTESQPRLGNFRHYILDGGKQSSNYFFGMTHDDQGQLWFANRGKGVFTIKNDKLVHVPPKDQFTNKSLNDAFAVLWVDGDLWVGTGCGIVIKHKDGTESYLTTNEGLPNNTIHALLETSNGNVIATTNNGIACFLQGNPKSVVIYDDYNISEYCDGAAVFTNNKAFFGGTKGFSILHYNERPPRIETTPQLVYTGLTILGREDNIFKYLDPNSSSPTLHLDYTQATFSITLASLNYSDEPELEYYYRMSPREEWIKNGVKKEISFFRLPTGNHTLYVKYKNPVTGEESPTFNLHIHITPPWYWAWWSKLLYLLIIALILVYLIRQMWRRQQHRQQEQLARLEQQHRDEMYEEKLNFLTNVVHELNTPLTLIYGPCERIFSYAGTDGFVKKYIRQIEQNLSRIHFLIQEIIDFRRVTTGHHSITIKRVDVSSFVSDTANAYQEIADRNNITLKQDIAEDIIWNTDERALLRIVSNLVSNAFKYTHKDGTVSVHLSVADEDLCLSVYNTGKGIAPEDKERIFNYYTIFEQVDEGTTRGLTSRNGLGMAICHKMVMKLGGTIEIDSQVGEFAKFIVRLPQMSLAEGTSEEVVTAKDYIQNPLLSQIREAEHKPADVPVRPTAGKEPSEEGATILVIDDNQDILDMLTDCLEEYHVVTATHAEEGLSLIKETPPDLIITDIMMPGINGLDLTQSIKQNKHTMHLPLIILSAKTSEEEKIEGLESGADIYISKPFNINYLRATINRLLENRAILKEYYNSSASAYTYTAGKLMKNEDREFLAELTKVLDAHLGDSDLTPEGLADLMHTSSRNLYRWFKEMELPSPKEFLRNHRVEAAAKLLTTTNMTVQEIIFDCGFNTRTQFYNDFRRQYGMTPKEYREKHKFKDESL